MDRKEELENKEQQVEVIPVDPGRENPLEHTGPVPPRVGGSCCGKGVPCSQTEDEELQ